jgi:large subunit ribosomal protein L18
MKSAVKQKRIKRQIRHGRVRSRVQGTGERPRLAVFRSSRHIYAQLIDDTTGKTLAMACSLQLLSKTKKTIAAAEVGKLLAKKALAKNLKAVVFDRGGFAYHGRVKALADGAREGGLKF